MSKSNDLEDLLDSLDEEEIEDNVVAREKAFVERFGCELKTLRSIEAPDPRKVLTWGGDWTIKLDSGREIYPTKLHQYAVHGGVLAGIPTYIERDLLRAIRKAGTLFGENVPPVLLEPVLRDLSSDKHEEPMKVMPAVCTIALFNSSTSANDDREVYSSLIAIWFGDRFGLPDDEDTLKKLRAVDWKGNAFDWTP
jgi:hypothetical protein